MIDVHLSCYKSETIFKHPLGLGHPKPVVRERKLVRSEYKMSLDTKRVNTMNSRVDNVLLTYFILW